MRCDICGRKIKSSGESITIINNKTYCSECSESKEAQAEIKSIKKQVNSIIGWIIGGIILLVLLIGGIVYWFYRRIN